jgi:hypothetical protein
MPHHYLPAHGSSRRPSALAIIGVPQNVCGAVALVAANEDAHRLRACVDLVTASYGAIAMCLEGSDGHAAIAGLTKGDALAASKSFSIAASAAVRAIDEHSAPMASQNALRLACERHAAVIEDVWCQADRERCAAAAFVEQFAATAYSASKLDDNGDDADKTPATRLSGATGAAEEPSTGQRVQLPKSAGPPSPPAPPSGTGEGEPAPPPVKHARENIN